MTPLACGESIFAVILLSFRKTYFDEDKVKTI